MKLPWFTTTVSVGWAVDLFVESADVWGPIISVVWRLDGWVPWVPDWVVEEGVMIGLVALATIEVAKWIEERRTDS